MISPRAVNNREVHHMEDASSSLLKLIAAGVRSIRRDRAYRVDWLNRSSYIAYHTYSIYRCITRSITNARPTGQPPCSPARLRYTRRRDGTVRCMFQEVCPGAMVMHSGDVVRPVSSNFAYPAFIRLWSGGFICIRNSPNKNFRFSISLHFFPIAGQQNVFSKSRWEIGKKKEKILSRRKQKGEAAEKKVARKSVIKFVIHRRFCQFSINRTMLSLACDRKENWPKNLAKFLRTRINLKFLAM